MSRMARTRDEASILIAQPPKPTHLVLVFHGVGATAQHMAPLGEAIALARPDAVVVSVGGPHPSTLGRGREWFSVVGITEQNRPPRIAQAMPLFLDTVRHWQQASGMGPAETVLVGFSQGAIMALESTQAQEEPDGLARRVVAIAGRFAQPVRHAPAGIQFHLIHGEQDDVMPPSFSTEAARALPALGADVTLDMLPGLGHAIDARAMQLAIGYVGGHRP
jgi:phospholipase/carboxylesterase